MPQAVAINPGSIHVCKARFTRLNADGSFAAGANSHVVTDQIMDVDYTPQIKGGETKELVSGCDCIPLAYRGFDKLMRVELKFQLATLAPALEELILGAALLVDTSTIPVPVGVVYPNQVSCTAAHQPAVACEFWSDAWDGDHQAAAPNRYVRWVFPMVFWQKDNGKLENDFHMPAFQGWTRANSNWTNVYADWPAGVAGSLSPFAWFWDNTQPAATVGYSSLST
jgi:hypothetical protein